MTTVKYKMGLEGSFTETYIEMSTPTERMICEALSNAFAQIQRQKANMAGSAGLPLESDDLFCSVMLFELICMFCAAAHARGLDFDPHEFSSLATRLAEQFNAEHAAAMRESSVAAGIVFT